MKKAILLTAIMILLTESNAFAVDESSFAMVGAKPPTTTNGESLNESLFKAVKPKAKWWENIKVAAPPVKQEGVEVQVVPQQFSQPIQMMPQPLPFPGMGTPQPQGWGGGGFSPGFFRGGGSRRGGGG